MTALTVSIDTSFVSLLGAEYITSFLENIAKTKLMKEYVLRQSVQSLQSLTPQYTQSEINTFELQKNDAKHHARAAYIQKNNIAV